MTFSISALPPEGAFQMFTPFQNLRPLGQKSYVQIFKRRSGFTIIKQNVPGGYVLSTMYIASIPKGVFIYDKHFRPINVHQLINL